MRNTITLHLLGSPILRLADGTAIKLRQKAYAMAALLFLDFRERTRRASLAERIWDRVETVKALNNLRQTLLHTRDLEEAHGFELFFTDLTDIELRASVTLDLRELRALRTTDDGAELQRLIDLYRGRLLDNVTGFGGGFEPWLRAQRLRLETQISTEASDAALRIGGDGAREALHRLTGLLPDSEVICRASVKFHLASGERDAAVAAYDAYRSRLKDRTGAEPPPDIDELLRRTPNLAARTSARPAENLLSSPAEDGAAIARQPRAIPRVVLLPPAQEDDLPELPRHLGPALVDDVTLGLQRLHSISVIAPFTARNLSPATALQDIRSHHIDYAVESRITRDAVGTGLSLLIQLIRSNSLQIVWAEKFPFSLAAAPQRYWDFTTAVARSLADGIENAELQQHRRERNADSYSHYLAGRDSQDTFDLQRIQRGRHLLQLAYEIEPDQASIDSAIARSYVIEWVLRAGADRALLEQAKLHAERAVQLDPGEGTAHRELGLVSMYDRRMDDSLAHMATAAELYPNHADVLADYADVLVHNSRFAAAEEKIAAAMRLNPLVPDHYLWTLGGIHFFRHRYELAINALQQMRNAEPALRLTAAAAAKANRPELAKDLRQRALIIQPDFSIDRWASHMPQRDPSDLRFYIEALREAGFT